MEKSLLNTFRSLSSDVKNILAGISSPLLLSFAAMRIGEEEGQFERLTAEHIVACLEAAGIALSRKAVISALSRAGDRVSRSKNIDGDVEYRLMIKGQREIAPYLGVGELSLVHIEGHKPRTARIKLCNILSNLQGLIRICDPYLGIRSLDSLDSIPPVRPVRFLTLNTTDSQRKLSGALRDFSTEHPKVEFRRAPTPSDIHDRYVITKSELLILGHGLKDIGGKESFMILLRRDIAADLIDEIISAFDSRWNAAAPF